MAGSPELQEAVYSKEPAASIIELSMTRENRFYNFLKRGTDIVVVHDALHFTITKVLCHSCSSWLSSKPYTSLKSGG